MELLKILLGTVSILVLGSGWLVFSFWLAFKAAGNPDNLGSAWGWFRYFATVSSTLVGGIVVFCYVMSKVTGET